MELSNYLVSWVVTYLGDLYTTYLYRGELIYLLSTSRTSQQRDPIFSLQQKKHKKNGPKITELRLIFLVSPLEELGAVQGDASILYCLVVEPTHLKKYARQNGIIFHLRIGVKIKHNK